MINIVLNDEPIILEQGNTISALLAQISIENFDRVAIAVNNQVVVRSNWAEHQLAENDQVMMFAPIQGG